MLLQNKNYKFKKDQYIHNNKIIHWFIVLLFVLYLFMMDEISNIKTLAPKSQIRIFICIIVLHVSMDSKCRKKFLKVEDHKNLSSVNHVTGEIE